MNENRERRKQLIAKRTFILAVFVSLLVCSQASFAQQASKGPGPRAIKLYFYHEPGEYIDLSPVTRMIRSAAPAHAAINALLAGPTPEEEREGFSGLASADQFRIATLTIRNGTARINFVSKRNWAGFPGDTAPIRFKKAVELTLKQFPNVKRVIVSLDGDLDFAS
jgi:spore germination protein GerM